MVFTVNLMDVISIVKLPLCFIFPLNLLLMIVVAELIIQLFDKKGKNKSKRGKK